MPPSATTTRAVLVLVATATLLGGCTTSVPAQAPTLGAPTGSLPSPTETLLPSDDADSRVGELVPGFPTALLPVPDGAQILVSSAEPTADGMVEVSLNLRSTLDVAALLDHVRAPLLAAGFAEVPAAPAQGLAAQTSFSRSDGKELLVAGIRDDGTNRTLTIGGRITPPAAG